MATCQEWGTKSFKECLGLEEKLYPCPTCHKVNAITIKEAATCTIECLDCRS